MIFQIRNADPLLSAFILSSMINKLTFRIVMMMIDDRLIIRIIKA